MKKNKLMIAIGVAVLVGIVSLLAYRVQNHSVSDGVIRIGAILPLTGAQSFYGHEVQNAMLLAEDEINKANKQKVKIVIEDSHDNPGQGLAIAQRMSSNTNFIALINGGSAVALSLASPAAGFMLPLIGTLASDEELSSQSEWSFRAYLSSRQQAEAMAEYAKKDLCLEKISMLIVNNEHGITSSRFFETKFTALGGQIVSKDMYDIAAVDLKTTIAKLIHDNPEGVYVFGYGVGYLSAINQLCSINYRGEILTMETMTLESVRSAIKDTERKFYFSGTSFDDEKNERANRFRKAYEGKFKELPSHVGAFAYDTVHFISQGLEEGHRDRSSLQEWLRSGNTVEGILGMEFFDESRNMVVPLSIFALDNGQIVSLKQIMGR